MLYPSPRPEPLSLSAPVKSVYRRTDDQEVITGTSEIESMRTGVIGRAVQRDIKDGRIVIEYLGCSVPMMVIWKLESVPNQEV